VPLLTHALPQARLEKVAVRCFSSKGVGSLSSHWRHRSLLAVRTGDSRAHAPKVALVLNTRR